MVNVSTSLCGSNAFQDYFDDAKESSLESKVKQVPRIKESFNQSKFRRIKESFNQSKFQRIKESFNQDSRFKIQVKNQEKTQLR